MFPLHLVIGSMERYWFEGIYFAIAILVGYLLATKVMKRHQVAEKEYSKVIFLSVIGGLIGARIFALIFWEDYNFLADPLRFFRVWEGGMTITGGIIGALVTAIIFAKKTKLQFFGYVAVLAPTILIAQGIGRIGCFLNGDAYGSPTNLPWGMEYPRYGTEVPGFVQNQHQSSAAWEHYYKAGLVKGDSTHTMALHPTQLYEAFFDFGFALFLALNYKKLQNKKFTTFAYIFGYSFFRFWVEYVRGDREKVVWLNTSAIQLVLLGISLVMIFFMIWSLKKPKLAK